MFYLPSPLVTKQVAELLPGPPSRPSSGLGRRRVIAHTCAPTEGRVREPWCRLHAPSPLIFIFLASTRTSLLRTILLVGPTWGKRPSLSPARPREPRCPLRPRGGQGCPAAGTPLAGRPAGPRLPARHYRKEQRRACPGLRAAGRRCDLQPPPPPAGPEGESRKAGGSCGGRALGSGECGGPPAAVRAAGSAEEPSGGSSPSSSMRPE